MNKHNDFIARCIVGSYQHRASWGSCKYRTADCSTDRTADCLSYFKYAINIYSNQLYTVY